MVKGEMRFFPEAMKTHFEATDGLNSCPTLQGAVFHNFFPYRRVSKGKNISFPESEGSVLCWKCVCGVCMCVCTCIYIGKGSGEIFGQR